MKSNAEKQEEIRKASESWKVKIQALEEKFKETGKAPDPKSAELIETLKKRMNVIDQHLQSADSESQASAGNKESELDRMLADIDETYREALAYMF